MKKWQIHTYLTALFPGLPGWDGTRKVKPIWILLKQETVSGSGISWATSAPRSRQITTPATHHSVFTGRMPFLLPNQQRQSTEGLIRINIQDKASENTTKKWQICISDEINEWDKVVLARKWRNDRLADRETHVSVRLVRWRYIVKMAWDLLDWLFMAVAPVVRLCDPSIR